MEQKPNEQRQAYTLYLQTEMTQEQIAELLKINRKTLHLWIKEGNWQRVKRTARYTPSMLADQYYRQLLAINDHIEMREEQPYPTKEESDVIRKLTLTIKQIKNRQTLNETLETLTMFMERLQQDNMELAQQIGPYTIKYVNSLAAKSTIDKTIDDMQQDFILEQELKDQNNSSSSENSSFEEDTAGVGHLQDVPHLSDEESTDDEDISYDDPTDNTSSSSLNGSSGWASEMSGEVCGINGASKTTQPIDSQYSDTPSQENNNGKINLLQNYILQKDGQPYTLPNGVTWLGANRVFDPAINKIREVKRGEWDIFNRMGVKR